MQIFELLELTYWIDENIKQNSIVANYQQLLSVLQQNANRRNNTPIQPFVSQQEQLIESIKDINTNGLTHAQEAMLNKLGIGHHIGSEGVDLIEDILFKNSLDIANASAEMAKLHQAVSSGVTKSDQVKAQLQPLIDVEQAETNVDAHEVLIRVHFQNEVQMENLTDFKRWGATWYDIGRGIAMAHDSSPEEVKVVGAQKGSIIIELATVAAIATTTSTIILAALKVADKVLAIRKKVEEIKALKLQNEKIAAEIEKEAENQKKTGLKQISDDLVGLLNLNPQEDGDKVKALEKAVKNLVDFVEKGGEVDFVSSDTEEQEKQEEFEQLRINFAEIKQLEKRLLALEVKSDGTN